MFNGLKDKILQKSGKVDKVKPSVKLLEKC